MQGQKRDLAILLVLQTLAITIGTVISHPESNIPSTITVPLLVADLLLLQFLLFRVTAGYAKTSAFKIIYAILLIIQFVLSGIVNVDTPLTETFVVASIAYPLFLVIFTIVFFLIVRDMFANKHDTIYGLLAASNAYLMIPVLFGTLYSIIVLHNPALLDAEIMTGNDLIKRTFEISHYVVAGFGVPDGVGGMIKNLAVVEAFMANLYIIFVVGRLMSNQK